MWGWRLSEITAGRKKVTPTCYGPETSARFYSLTISSIALARVQKGEWVERRAEAIQRNHPTRRLATEKQRVLAAWKSRWLAQESQRQSTPDYWNQIKRPPDPTILQLHKGLRKADSTILIHLRTGRIGLRHSLYKLGVPEYESGQCNCRTGLETPRHVLLECPYETEQRSALKEA
jgi:hypothetical protein